MVVLARRVGKLHGFRSQVHPESVNLNLIHQSSVQAVVDEVNALYDEAPEKEAVITTMHKVLSILVREGIARESVMTHTDIVTLQHNNIAI